MPPSFRRSRISSTSDFSFGEIAGYQKNDDDFGELRNLQMNSARQRDPARRSERPLADDQHRQQQDDRSEVQRIHVPHQRVIVDLRRNPHQQDAGCDEKDLLPPGALPDGAVCRTEDLNYTQRANRQDDE